MLALMKSLGDKYLLENLYGIRAERSLNLCQFSEF